MATVAIAPTYIDASISGLATNAGDMRLVNQNDNAQASKSSSATERTRFFALVARFGPG